MFSEEWKVEMDTRMDEKKRKSQDREKRKKKSTVEEE